MTMEDERNLDLMVAELDSENRLMRARNERLEADNERLREENARFKVTLERIIAVSQLAFRDSGPQGVSEMGAAKQTRRSED